MPRRGTYDEYTPNTPEAEVIRDLALSASMGVSLDPGEVRVFVLPGGEVRIVDGDEYADHPRRATGTFRPGTVQSFTDYVTRHKTDATSVWVNPATGYTVAVLDGHQPEKPGKGTHRAELALTKTPEWLRWERHDGQLLGQEDFAEHIEDSLGEIAEPDGATLLEIAQTMHGTTSANWRAARRLRDGSVHMQYAEEVTAQAGGDGELSVPQTFTLVLAPFVGESAVQIEARLRYRVSSGNLRIGYKLDNPERVLRDAITGVYERLRGPDGFAHVYLGVPAS